jgi:hypothetical protein
MQTAHAVTRIPAQETRSTSKNFTGQNNIWAARSRERALAQVKYLLIAWQVTAWEGKYGGQLA